MNKMINFRCQLCRQMRLKRARKNVGHSLETDPRHPNCKFSAAVGFPRLLSCSLSGSYLVRFPSQILLYRAGVD